MYTFGLTLCTLIAAFGFAAVAFEKVLDRLVFDGLEDDTTDYGEE